jgi:hypothetical protein
MMSSDSKAPPSDWGADEQVVSNTSSRDLEFAAHLGDVDAMRALGLDRVAPRGFEEWAWGFSRFGQRIMARAALVAARLALPIWEHYVPCDAVERSVFGGRLVADSLNTVEQWLASDAQPLEDVASLLSALRDLAARTSFYVAEASGDESIVLSRERALSAAIAAVAALEAFAWTEDQAVAEVEDPSDPAGPPSRADSRAELDARKAAGPALQVVQAFSHASLATGIDAHGLREELRSSLLANSESAAVRVAPLARS